VGGDCEAAVLEESEGGAACWPREKKTRLRCVGEKFKSGKGERLWFGFKRRGAVGLCVQGKGGLRPPLVLSGFC